MTVNELKRIRGHYANEESDKIFAYIDQLRAALSSLLELPGYCGSDDLILENHRRRAIARELLE